MSLRRLLAALVLVAACSDAQAPAPPSSASSSSSSGGPGDAAATACDPTGTYQVSEERWTPDGGICTKMAEKFGLTARTVTYEPRGGNEWLERNAVSGGDAITYTLDRDLCTLSRKMTDTLDTQDVDGRDIVIERAATYAIRFDGLNATYGGTVTVTSTSESAEGVPCKLVLSTTAAKTQ